MCFDVWYLLFTSTFKFIFWSQVFYLIWYCRSIREIFSRWYVNEEWTYMIMFVKWLMQGLQNTQSFLFFSAWWIKITYYEIDIQMKQLKIAWSTINSTIYPDWKRLWISFARFIFTNFSQWTTNWNIYANFSVSTITNIFKGPLLTHYKKIYVHCSNICRLLCIF